MTSEIIDVLIKQCEAGIERHKMNVRVLTEKRVGLAEHGDLIVTIEEELDKICLLYTSPSPRDRTRSRMPSSA